MESLESGIDRMANESGFSGVVRVDHGREPELAVAYGLAHRALDVANTVETQFATASGAKGLTALTVVSLVADGTLDLSTPARSVLGGDLPLIADDVTVEHLLAHRSGIGDYLDEDSGVDVADYLMPVPVHRLATTEQYLAVLDGHPQKFPAGEQFSYCNGGYVVLALIAERASGVPFHDLVHQRVCQPAEMIDTAFLRSDDLPGRAAIGYVEMDGVLRSNVLHLPVRGSGDGGVYTTVADVSSLWMALFSGVIVPEKWVGEMVRPRSIISPTSRYGLGLWLDGSSDAVSLEGCDAGVSFCSWHHPGRSLTYTVLSNSTDGAWPVMRYLRNRLAPGAAVD